MRIDAGDSAGDGDRGDSSSSAWSTSAGIAAAALSGSWSAARRPTRRPPASSGGGHVGTVVMRVPGPTARESRQAVRPSPKPAKTRGKGRDYSTQTALTADDLAKFVTPLPLLHDPVLVG